MSVSDDVRSLTQHVGELTQAVVGVDTSVDQLRERVKELTDAIGRIESQSAVLVAEAQKPSYWQNDPWVRRGLIFFFIFAVCMFFATIGGIALGDGTVVKAGIESITHIPAP